MYIMIISFATSVISFYFFRFDVELPDFFSQSVRSRIIEFILVRVKIF